MSASPHDTKVALLGPAIHPGCEGRIACLCDYSPGYQTQCSCGARGRETPFLAAALRDRADHERAHGIRSAWSEHIL